MRLDTAILVAKGISHWLIGTFTPWTAALAQWANSGEWPSKIVWIGIIMPASVVGGASALLSFLSGSYSKYVADKAPRQAIADAAAAKLKAVQEEVKVAEMEKKVEEIKT
jgi:hypothetical protein